MTKQIMFIHKIKAALLHLALSIVAITLLISLILLFWYPDSLIKVSSFKEIAMLIIMVDLVLGPLLTFIVFKPKKKTLKFDLSTIVAIQVSALAYGLFTLYQAHPVFITFNVDRFTLVTAREAQPEKAVLEKFKISKFSSPQIAIAKFPTDQEENNKLVLEILKGKPDIYTRAKYYHPVDENISEILAKSLDPELVFKDKESKQKLDVFIKKYGKTKSDYAYLPLEGTSSDAIWVLDKTSAKPIDIIQVYPWITTALNTKASDRK